MRLMRSGRRMVLVVTTAAGVLAGAVPAGADATAGAAPSYTFAIVADSSKLSLDPASFGCPAINDRGDVALRADTVGGVDVIWEARADGTTVPIASTTGRFASLGRNPSINDAGQVAFTAGLESGEDAIVRGRGGPVTFIAATTGRFSFFGFDVSLNDAGRVAFKADVDDTDQGLFSGAGAQVATTYLASRTQFDGDRSAPSINDRGQIAFIESLDQGGSGIFRADAGSFTTIVQDGGPLVSVTIPSLNDGGVAAFVAFLAAGGEAILAGNGLALRTLADTNGPFQRFGDPSLNDQNQIAANALLHSGDEGVFTGPQLTTRVIGTGDPLDGSTVTTTTLCREGLNNGGQLAFHVQLLDGRTLVVRATPA